MRLAKRVLYSRPFFRLLHFITCVGAVIWGNWLASLARTEHNRGIFMAEVMGVFVLALLAVWCLYVAIAEHEEVL